MTRTAPAIALLLAVVGCSSPAPTMTTAHAAAIRDSAEVFLADFTRLSAEAQWDSVGAMYSDRADFRFLESGQLRYASAEAVRAALADVPAGARIETTHEDVSVQAIAPGVSTLSARFTTRFVDSTGVLFTFSGAMSLVLQHEPDGWRIVSGHSSAPVARGG